MTYRLPNPTDWPRLIPAFAHSRLAVSLALHLAAGALLTGALAVLLSGRGGLWNDYPIFALGCYVVIAGLTTLHLGGHAPHVRFGPANRVTLVRGVLASLLGGAIPFATGLTPAALWIASAVALVALTLDGVDGWVARRTGMATEYGKHLDINFDTMLMGILAVLVWQDDKAGIWVLLIGLMRHVFVLAVWIWPVLRGELPFSQRRRIVCVVQIAALLVCLTPAVTTPFSSLAAGAALGLLLFSFAVDTVWLVKNAGVRQNRQSDAAF